jgi:uncharacterized membrane protein
MKADGMGHKRTRTGRIAHPRYMAFFALLVTGVAVLGAALPLEMALIGGFDLAAGAFALSLLPAWQHSAPDTIRKTAARDDGGRQILLALTAIIVTVVTLSVAVLIKDKDALTVGRIALLVLTLLSGWVFTNLVFAIHYAHVFYDAQPGGDDQGGLDFPGGDAPIFADFVYFSFVIGMTCQTADINLTSQVFRRVVTFHGLFAFVFNLGILALMVNVIAGAH